MSIHFNINTQKAIEAVLWIIQKGESNLYNIMKILYAAEKYHLNTYGRPITGDRYVAMEHGTVPSWIYNTAKVKKPGFGFYRADNLLKAERPADLDYLSESDIEALGKGFAEYAKSGFEKVRNKNHKDNAWENAYGKRGDKKAAFIPFEDMIDKPWLKDDLAVIGQFMDV